MQKRNLFTIFSFIITLLISGCGQEPPKTTNIAKQEQKAEKPKPKEQQKTQSTTDFPVAPTVLNELKVHNIDVGQGDSTLFQFSDDGENYTLLIDAGNWNGDEVINYLRSQKVSKIDIAIGTHPDADHIGQLDKVINTFEVGEVWLSGNTNASQTFQRLLSAIDSQGVDYYEPRTGDEFEIGHLKIDVLSPKTISEHDNEESIALKLTYGDVRFIYTGDATTDNELKMLQSGIDVKADILHLGHHGSSTSTDPVFLKAVNPTVAIYSAGIDNSYGHPHTEVVKRVQSAGIKLYGTDVHGTIIVLTDGKSYKISTKKDGTITPSSSRDVAKDDSASKHGDGAIKTGDCIDINSAPIDQLQEIIHFGPARAKDLVKLRPFSSLDDLSRISGIGPARIADIKAQGLACIGGG